MSFKIRLVFGFILVLLTVSQLHAEEVSDLLLQKNLISEEEFNTLKHSQKNVANIYLDEGLKFVSEDGTFKAQIGTLMQFDSAFYDGEIRTIKNSQNLINDGSEFRRIRLYLAGTFSSVWDYRTEMEFSGVPQITLGYVSYHGFDIAIPTELIIGQVKIPFSQELMTTEKSTIFMERSLANVFLNTLAPGVTASSWGKNWSSTFMLHGEQLSVPASAGSDERGGFSWRSTYAPIANHAATLHFGVSLASKIPSENNLVLNTDPVSYTEAVRFRIKPESNIIETRLLDSGLITNVSRTDLIGYEIAGNQGPFSFSGEYIKAVVNRTHSLPDISFDGWYLQTSLALTGETHEYIGGKGIYDILKPKRSTENYNGMGAWEIALRISGADVSDKSFVSNSSLGTKERNATLGLNWYLNKFVKAQLNYVHVLDISGDNIVKANLNTTQLRFQISY